MSEKYMGVPVEEIRATLAYEWALLEDLAVLLEKHGPATDAERRARVAALVTAALIMAPDQAVFLSAVGLALSIPRDESIAEFLWKMRAANAELLPPAVTS